MYVKEITSNISDIVFDTFKIYTVLDKTVLIDKIYIHYEINNSKVEFIDFDKILNKGIIEYLKFNGSKTFKSISLNWAMKSWSRSKLNVEQKGIVAIPFTFKYNGNSLSILKVSELQKIINSCVLHN